MASKHIKILERRAMELRARDEALATALNAFAERSKEQSASAPDLQPRKWSLKLTRKPTRIVSIRTEPVEESISSDTCSESKHSSNVAPDLAPEDLHTNNVQPQFKRNSHSGSRLKITSPTFNLRRLGRSVSKGASLKVGFIRCANCACCRGKSSSSKSM
jgi:hypothetical protein